MNSTDLKKYMLKNKLSQRTLAKLLSVEESQISRWVTGRTSISRAWQVLIDLKLKNS